MNRTTRVTALLLGGAAAGFTVGCTQLTGVTMSGPLTTQPAGDEQATADAQAFAPLRTPPGADAKRARLTLADIPDDPPAPAATPSTQPAQANAQAERYLQEAQRLFGEQRFTETIVQLEKALRYDPESHAANRLLAIACLMSGNDARARLAAERALSIKADDLASEYVMARTAAKSGKIDEALRHYRLALKCTPGKEDASYVVLTNYFLGSLLFDGGYFTAAAAQLTDFERGLAAAGETVKDNPELLAVAHLQRGVAAARLARAQAYVGNDAAAVDALRRAVADSPKDADLRVEYIRMLVRAHRTAPAEAEAAKFVEDTHGSRNAVELLLSVYRYTGHPERGVAAIKTIVAGQPDNVELSMLYADALAAAGRYSDAAKALDALLARHPEARDARWKLISLYRARGDWAGYIDAQARTVADDPGESARVRPELDRVPEATARKLVADALRERAPSSAPAATTQPADVVAAARDYLLGVLADRLNQVSQAQRLFERALAAHADFVPATLGLAEMHMRRCQWNKALPVLEAAEGGAAGKDHQVAQLLGRCYDGLDDLEQARAYYEKAIELDAADTRSMVLLGELFERYGRIAEAQKQYQNAVATDGHNMTAREDLVQNLLLQAGRGGNPQVLLGGALAEVTAMQRMAPADPATIRTAALVQYLSSRQREPYLQTLRKLISERPDDMTTREDLAKVLFDLRDYVTARTELGEMLARDACSSTANELLASVQIKLLNYDEAAEQFRRMLKLYPNREAWIRQFIELNLVLQDYDGAIALCQQLLDRKAVKGKPEHAVLYRTKVVQCYRLAGRRDDARKALEGWLAEPKVDDRIRRVYRTLLLALDADAKDYPAYVERCRKWLAAEPDSQELRAMLLLGLTKVGRDREAEALTLSWLADKPQDASSLEWLSDVLMRAGRKSEAVELARNQLAATDDPRERLVRMGMLVEAYRRAGKFDEAVALLKQIAGDAAQGAGATSSQLDQMQARILIQAKRYDEAASLINRLIRGAETDERKAELLRVLSLALQRQGQIDLAEQRLREAHQLQPTDVGINNDLGYILADSGRHLEEARTLIRAAVAEEPLQGAYLDSYGWALYKLGEFAEARQWLARATKSENGEDPVLFEHLGDTQWRTGEKDAAVKSWQRGLAIQADKAAEGEDNGDQDAVEELKARIDAAKAGKAPPVASTGLQSQPAP
jgi:tetratricopeptide (TPR) repeat protein